MRKAIWTVVFIILGVSVYYYVSSNPVFVPYFNEFGFTTKGWILEIQLTNTENTTGWFLESMQGTAHLKPMVITKNIQYVITQDSLLEPLTIDPDSDYLSLNMSNGIPIGNLMYGHREYEQIAAPKVGQSICLLGEIFLYLDNTPTFGYPNDTLNSTGYISGYVRTNTSQPLQAVKVTSDGDTSITDIIGFYKISSIAQIQYLTFSKQNYISQHMFIQVLPESTITINVELSPVVSVERIESQIIPKDFSISEPFPNPFNPEMRIQYSLPRKGDVRIDVFDISGKLVDKVFSGYQSAGSYQVHWNAAHFPSGVYIIRIQAGEIVLSKKCALVK